MKDWQHGCRHEPIKMTVAITFYEPHRVSIFTLCANVNGKCSSLYAHYSKDFAVTTISLWNGNVYPKVGYPKFDVFLEFCHMLDIWPEYVW